MLTRGREMLGAFWFGVLAVVCCAGLPAVLAFAGGLTVVGLVGGVLAATVVGCAAVIVLRARSRRERRAPSPQRVGEA